MKKNMTINDITPEIKEAVKAFLLSRVYAETMRDEVDKVHKEILTECPIYADRFEEVKQIFKSDDLYLCSDDNLCQEFYDEANKRLRNCGLKPDSMPDSHCPALVAEHLQVIAANSLIDVAEALTGIKRTDVYMLDDRKKYIDLLCKLVVNLPDWENPLKKIA